MKVYLDNAATTRLDKRVLEAMKPYMTGEEYGNPSSIHALGQEAFLALQKAKEKAAKILGGEADSIIFTSGATESNNLMIKGVALANKDKGNRVIVSNIEHPCVRESAKELSRLGFDVQFVPADKEGVVRPEALEQLLDEKTILVSIMAVNNEIGTINDIAALAAVAHKKGALFHSDAVQAVPYLKLDVKEMGIDLMSLSAHKFYGPKGVGLAYVKKGIKLQPQIVGGGQENNLRSGTYNLAGIIGLVTALEIAYKERGKYLKKVKALRDRFWKKLQQEVPGVKLNGSLKERVPANLNVMFGSVEGEAILMDLSYHGVYVSTGSACSASDLHASYVLSAIELDKNYLNSNIRFSFGRFNNEKEIDYAINCIKKTVARLRSFSPIR